MNRFVGFFIKYVTWCVRSISCNAISDRGKNHGEAAGARARVLFGRVAPARFYRHWQEQVLQSSTQCPHQNQVFLLVRPACAILSYCHTNIYLACMFEKSWKNVSSSSGKIIRIIYSSDLHLQKYEKSSIQLFRLNSHTSR